MSWFIPSEIAQIVLSAVLAMVFLYLYLQDRQRFILFWSLGWAIWSAKYIFEILIFRGCEYVSLLTANLICWQYGALFLSCGTLVFIQKNIPAFWQYGSGLLTLWIIIMSFTGNPFYLAALPLFFYLGVVFIWTGTAFLRSDKIAVTGKYIPGWSFVFLGIHIADYPVVSRVEWLAPWGYLAAGILSMVVAHGLLLVYYQKLRQDLYDSEARFRLMAENARDILYRYRFTAPRGIDYISPSVESITGYNVDDFYTDPDLYRKLAHPDDRNLIDGLLNSASAVRDNLILRWLCKDGGTIWVEQRNTVIYNSKGMPTAFEGIIRDITQRKRAEEDTALLEKARRHFLTNISHDLKTPITSIQGYVEALLDNMVTDPAEQKNYLKLIHSRVLGLNRLIQDLFLLARLESRSLSFNMDRIRPDLFIQEVYDRYRVDLENAGFSFFMEKPRDSYADKKDYPLITADPDRIDLIFSNLVANSIRYCTPGDTVTLGFDFLPESREFLVIFRDSGPGISQDDLLFIFDRFYKASKSRNTSSGSGLGLAIAREITEAHGGRIWAESIPGKGTVFYFTLPWA